MAVSGILGISVVISLSGLLGTVSSLLASVLNLVVGLLGGLLGSL